MSTESYAHKQKNNSLADAVDRAMSFNSEAERVFAVIDLIRGYNPNYDEKHRYQEEGYMACKEDLKTIRDKVKRHLSQKYYPEMKQLNENNGNTYIRSNHT